MVALPKHLLTTVRRLSSDMAMYVSLSIAAGTRIGSRRSCQPLACLTRSKIIQHTIYHHGDGRWRTFKFTKLFLCYSQAKHWVDDVDSLTAKSVPAGAKLVLFGRYIVNFYVGIDT